ncbi:hypothetical protein G6F40_017462 [Rhizopus arrhizus]|nr:hypothetical protein G6F40_017462 [Rhizopus arrhizus]
MVSYPSTPPPGAHHGSGTRLARQEPAGRNQRHHRDPEGLGAGEVRSGQGNRRDLRRPHPVHPDALPVQLRLHSADPVRRR